MGKFIKGDIVVIPFPFSDLSDAKRRPALVLSDLKGDDVILCQITSQNVSDEYGVEFSLNDYSEGSLNQVSNIRPNRLFTADYKIILYKAGHITDQKYQEAVNQIMKIINKKA